jgi:hypothetical protein
VTSASSADFQIAAFSARPVRLAISSVNFFQVSKP